jgi:rod shape-determining protein MreC
MAVPARDRRTGFSRRRQYSAFLGYVLAVGGALAGAALLALSHFDPPAFAALRMGAASVTAPVSAGLNRVVGWVAVVPDSIGEHWRVAGENRRLRAEVARDRALVMRARAVAHDNRRLRTLLALRDRTAETVTAARLVSSTASSARRFALLDAGAWVGVTPGMPVIGPDGLVGRVTETGPAVARVMLLTDAQSLVPARRTRDGMTAIVAGRGDGLVDVRAVSANARLRPGDLFVTTGTGGVFAPGTPVARVIAPGMDSAPARPLEQPDGLDFALVTRPFLPVDAPPATPPR